MSDLPEGRGGRLPAEGEPARVTGWLTALYVVLALALLFVILATFECMGAGGGGTMTLDPVVVDRQTPTALEPVAFLSGCWRGLAADGATVIEERWTTSEGGVMLATTRYIRDDRVVSWEFSHLSVQGERIVLTPFPGGGRSEHSFARTGGGSGLVVFEAPEHDYPKRITYALSDAGELAVTIDGGPGDVSPRGWTLQKVRCEG